MEPCKLIAEIGNTHIGDINRAKKLIQLAYASGADYVKLQKRNPIESTPKHIQNLPHPNQMFAYGKTYLEHRQNIELSIGQHGEIKEFCDGLGVKYSSSVWDITSARQIMFLEPDFIKVPSACNQNIQLLDVLFKECKCDIHISLGMLGGEDQIRTVNFLKKYKCSERIVLYHCTSEYPCPIENLFLNQIKLLTKYKDDGFRIGFSNHGPGIACDVAAYVLGAEWIERHFIDDRTFRHSDAAASLEVSGLSKLTRDLRAVHKAMQDKVLVTEEERVQMQKLQFLGN